VHTSQDIKLRSIFGSIFFASEDAKRLRRRSSIDLLLVG
jgi:hypothetical protein